MLNLSAQYYSLASRYVRVGSNYLEQLAMLSGCSNAQDDSEPGVGFVKDVQVVNPTDPNFSSSECDANNPVVIPPEDSGPCEANTFTGTEHHFPLDGTNDATGTCR